MGKFAFRHEGSSGKGDNRRDEFTFQHEDVSGHLRIHPKGKQLKVVYVGASKEGSEDDTPNVLGPVHVRGIIKGIKEHYPKAERVYGARTSGARYHGMSDDEYDEAGGQAGTLAGFKLK